jgi:hypothetical protein
MGNCDLMPNGQRMREGTIFDTFEVAATAVPASVVLFDNSSNGGINTHKCNLPQRGELGDGERFLVRNIMLEFIGTSIADISQILKAYTITVEIGQQKVVRDQALTLYPQLSGAWGIEGSNGGSTNGPCGWGSLKPLDEPIEIPGKKTIRVFLNKTGTTVAAGAGGIFMRVHFYGTDGTAG